jgi:NTP pyrophosphatase (non-canonical NTP hydrolase)
MIWNEKNRKRADTISDHYGLESQMSVAQEECAELIQAISKLRRAGAAGLDTAEKRIRYVEARSHLAEEMADVANLLMQLTHLLNNTPMVEFWLNQKLERTLRDIREEGA